MKFDFILPIIVIAFVAPFLLSTQAFGIEDVNQYTMKTVYEFDIQRNINALKTDIINELVPALESRINTFGDNFTNFSFYLEDPNTGVYNVGIEQGTNHYEFYPKISLSGSNQTMTEGEFRTEYNILVGQIHYEVVAFLQDQDATNVKSHLHFTYGSMDLDEGF